MVALGIAVFINPIAAVENLVRIMGWILVVYGVITLVAAFMKGDPARNAPAELAMGIVSLVPGLVMGIAPGVLVSIVWTLIGVIVVLTGVLDISEASLFRRTRSPLALPATASGVITVLLGVVVIFAPMASATLAMLAAAIALFVDGVTEIIFGLGM